MRGRSLVERAAAADHQRHQQALGEWSALPRQLHSGEAGRKEADARREAERRWVEAEWEEKRKAVSQTALAHGNIARYAVLDWTERCGKRTHDPGEGMER